MNKEFKTYYSQQFSHRRLWLSQTGNVIAFAFRAGLIGLRNYAISVVLFLTLNVINHDYSFKKLELDASMLISLPAVLAAALTAFEVLFLNGAKLRNVFKESAMREYSAYQQRQDTIQLMGSVIDKVRQKKHSEHHDS